MEFRWLTAVFLELAVLGCDPGSGREPAGLSSGVMLDDAGGEDDDEEDEDENDEEGDQDETRLDAGSGSGSRDGCTAVDLLFVIDNSGSMCDAQEGLAAALPGLVDAIYESLPVDTDIHVGITTTSFSDGGSHQQRDCVAAEAPAVILEHFVTETKVEGNGYQGRLFEYDSKAYFTANTGDPDGREPLREWFSAATRAVGCNGGAFEFTAAAAAYATAPGNADANDGFLRDAGAALAIFVLSNEVDQSPDAASAYADMVRAAKGECGGNECIVTAGLLGADCVPSADPLVWQFLGAFGKDPAWGDILDFGGYGEVVSVALADAIVDTCDDIAPAG